MRPRQEFPEGTKELMEKLLKETKTVIEMKRIQCILFRVREDYDNSIIAKSVGYSEDSIKNIHSKFIRYWEKSLIEKKKWWRYNAHMTKKEEEQILSSCNKKGNSWEILEVSLIKTAYEAKLGHSVNETIIYRMLHAHWWRKIAPRPQHPKHNKESAEDFKKNFQNSLQKNERYLWTKEEIWK